MPGIWERFRRRSMAPRRPAVFPDQWALLIVTLAVVALGVFFIVLALVAG